MTEFNSLRRALEDDTVSDEALDFMADPYADRVTRLRRSGQASPELEAFLARTGAVQEQREAERAVEAASRFPPVVGRETSVYDSENLGPIEKWSDDLVVLAAGQGRPEAIAERARRTDSLLGKSRATTPAPDVRASAKPPALAPAPRAPVAVSPRKFTAPETVIAGPTPSYTLEEIRDPAVYAPENMLSPLSKEQTATPLSSEQFAATSRRMRERMAEDDAQYAAKPPAVAPVPTASSTGPVMTSPPPPKGVAEARVPPPPSADSAEGAGGDADLRRLYLAQLAARVGGGLAEITSGGRKIDTGIEDMLGERFKQAQALQAKRAEKAEDLTREQAQYEGANLATLTTNLASFKDRPDIVAALENMRSGAKYTKPSDFLKGVYQAVTNPPKVEGLAADVKLKGAKEDTEVAKGAEVGPEGISKRGLRSSQEDLNRARAAALRLDATRKARVASEVRAAKTSEDPVRAEKAITDALKTAEDKKSDVVNTTNNFLSIEKVAPGFAKGQVPDWLGRYTLQAAAEVPALSKQAAALNSALESFVAKIRNSLFGASLTGREEASFNLIADRRLTSPPEQLAAAINVLREGAARFAQNHFVVPLELYPEMTTRILNKSSVFGPALGSGGIYSDVWSLPKAGPAAGGAGNRQQKPKGSEGYTPLWNKSQGKWQEIPNDKVEAAKASGRFEE